MRVMPRIARKGGRREFLGLFAFTLLQCRVLHAQVADIQCPGDDRQDDIQPKGLQHIVQRAELQRRDRRIDRAMPGHDDAGDVRIDGPGGTEQFDAVHLGHHEVRQEQIALAGADRA
jgi:hypothetical protein